MAGNKASLSLFIQEAGQIFAGVSTPAPSLASHFYILLQQHSRFGSLQYHNTTHHLMLVQQLLVHASPAPADFRSDFPATHACVAMLMQTCAVHAAGFSQALQPSDFSPSARAAAASSMLSTWVTLHPRSPWPALAAAGCSLGCWCRQPPSLHCSHQQMTPCSQTP